MDSLRESSPVDNLTAVEPVEVEDLEGQLSDGVRIFQTTRCEICNQIVTMIALIVLTVLTVYSLVENPEVTEDSTSTSDNNLTDSVSDSGGHTGINPITLGAIAIATIVVTIIALISDTKTRLVILREEYRNRERGVALNEVVVFDSVDINPGSNTAPASGTSDLETLRRQLSVLQEDFTEVKRMVFIQKSGNCDSRNGSSVVVINLGSPMIDQDIMELPIVMEEPIEAMSSDIPSRVQEGEDDHLNGFGFN